MLYALFYKDCAVSMCYNDTAKHKLLALCYGHGAMSTVLLALWYWHCAISTVLKGQHCVISTVLLALCISIEQCTISTDISTVLLAQLTVFYLICAYTAKKLAQPRKKIAQTRLHRLHVFPSLTQTLQNKTITDGGSTAPQNSCYQS